LLFSGLTKYIAEFEGQITTLLDKPVAPYFFIYTKYT